MPIKTSRKLGRIIRQLIAYIARTPFERSRELNAFIMKVEKDTNRPAIMPLPTQEKINVHLRKSTVPSIKRAPIYVQKCAVIQLRGKDRYPAELIP